MHDEIISTENKYKMISDDKIRGDMENRSRLDRDIDEVNDVRKQINELKYLLSEKQVTDRLMNFQIETKHGSSRRACQEQKNVGRETV